MYDSLHPAVLRALAMIAHDAERFGIDLRLCGEMAGDPDVRDDALSASVTTICR
ncbi:hypothetical protein MJ390_24305 [Klebsiella pneumoniae]|nr:hypothetical protein MJ390_24305 [Klebsiella pneumoniae]